MSPKSTSTRGSSRKLTRELAEDKENTRGSGNAGLRKFVWEELEGEVFQLPSIPDIQDTHLSSPFG
jgi:hypothetical protein